MIDLWKSKDKKVSEYKNPFSSDKVDAINFFINKGIFDGKISYKSYIKFKNGNSSGEQKIEASDFNELVKKTDEFIKSLS